MIIIIKKLINEAKEIANKKETDLLFVSFKKLFSIILTLELTKININCVGIWDIKHAKIIYFRLTLAAPQAAHFIKDGI